MRFIAARVRIKEIKEMIRNKNEVKLRINYSTMSSNVNTGQQRHNTNQKSKQNTRKSYPPTSLVQCFVWFSRSPPCAQCAHQRERREESQRAREKPQHTFYRISSWPWQPAAAIAKWFSPFTECTEVTF